MYFRESGGMYWVGLNDREKEECMLKAFITSIVLKKKMCHIISSFISFNFFKIIMLLKTRWPLITQL